MKKALVGLLRDPENNICADCKAVSHPRWASWSLGVFICIKCAGIHRSLGTHITKVKSVDLDTWKEEHLMQLIKMSNNRIANDYYEAKLPEPMQKPITDSNQLQTFIRNKYEKKKWVGTKVQSQPKQKVEEELQPSTESLLSDIEDTKPVENMSSSLLDLQLSSVPKPRSEKLSREANRPDLKKSILSLYSKPNNNATTNSFYQAKSSTGSSLSSTNSNTNTNSNPANISVASLDDNELFKNVWTT